jgi:hypothetical protein
MRIAGTCSDRSLDGLAAPSYHSAASADYDVVYSLGQKFGTRITRVDPHARTSYGSAHLANSLSPEVARARRRHQPGRQVLAQAGTGRPGARPARRSASPRTWARGRPRAHQARATSSQYLEAYSDEFRVSCSACRRE